MEENEGTQGGTEREDGSQMSGREAVVKENDIQTHPIRWTVPLSQFQLDPLLYRPKTPLWSSIITTSTGLLSLDWQLSLSQHRKEAKVELHYMSRDIPHQGVQYTVYARRADGMGRSRLNLHMRRCLATYGGNRPGIPGRLKEVFVRRILQRNSTIDLEVMLKISTSLWSPQAVIATLLAEERAKEENESDGTVGAKLWQQVAGGRAENPPPEADITFICPRDERIYAHKAVVATFCPRFAATLARSKKGKWTIGCHEISACALWEVLHFIYLRKVSPSLYKTPLGQVLEGYRLFNQPRLLSLEVEKLLIHLLQHDNLERLFALAYVYRLDVLLNACHTIAKNQPHLQSQLQMIKASIDQPSQPIPASFQV